jgi:hypothetical protein
MRTIHLSSDHSWEYDTLVQVCGDGMYMPIPLTLPQQPAHYARLIDCIRQGEASYRA